MRIKTVNGLGGQPVVLDRKILGFRLTYREYMKSMPDGYQGKEVKCPKTKLGNWITNQTKKIVKRLFPDYVVETKAQYNARMKANHDSEMMGIETAEIKKVKFFDEDIEKMKNMTLDERLAYKSKLKREGRYTYEK